MNMAYGEPVPPVADMTAPPVAGTVASGGPVVVTGAPVAPEQAPAPTEAAQQPAGEPAASSVPAATVPPVGTLARYTTYDPYASPARNRDQLVLVTGHAPQADGTIRVLGYVLGWAEDAAHFLAENLHTT